MTVDPNEDPQTGGVWPQGYTEEPATESCVALLHFMRASVLDGVQHRMLLADYAARRPLLPPGLRAGMDDDVFESYLPTSRPLSSVQDRLASAGVSDFDVEADGILSTVLATDLSINPQPNTAASASEVVPISASPADAGTITADVVVLAPVGNELRAVRDIFRASAPDPGAVAHRIYFASVPCAYARAKLTVAVVPFSSHADSRSAHAPDSDVIRYCAPGSVFLVSASSGNKKRVKLGDVVVPSKIITAANHSGRELEVPSDLQYNLECYDVSSASYRRELKAFLKRLGPEDRPPRLVKDYIPRVFLGATSMSIPQRASQADTSAAAFGGAGTSPVLTVDDIAWSFASAHATRWWSVWTGVSDYGDREKAARWRYLATSAAALCLKEFLQTEYVPPLGRVF